MRTIASEMLDDQNPDEDEFLALVRQQKAAPPRPATAQAPAAEEDEFAALARQAQPPEGSFRALVRKAGETAQDVLAAGLSNVPLAPTLYGATRWATSRIGGEKPMSAGEGAREFQGLVETARGRSPVVAGPVSPPALAGGALPYLSPYGQATRLGRALYSAVVGGIRSGERAAIAGEGAGDVAKSAVLGAVLEAGTGFLLGEPAGAAARAMQTPRRVPQVTAQTQRTTRAETPLYEAWTGYAQRGTAPVAAPLSPPTPALAAALDDPLVRQAVRTAKQIPDLRKMPSTAPAVLDRAYKLLGNRAFRDKYTVQTEAAQGARDLLRQGMDEARPDFPYSQVLDVARQGRQTREAIEMGAEAARIASRASPASLPTALRGGEDALAEYLKTATPEQRQAVIQGIYGYVREAPKMAGIPLGTRARVPVPFVPSRSLRAGPRLAELAGDRPTMLQRGVRGGVASAPSMLGNLFAPFFE